MGAKSAPRCLQEPKRFQEAAREPFWINFGAHLPILGCFLYNVGLFANQRTCILVQLQAVLFYFYFRHAVCEVAGFGGACPL